MGRACSLVIGLISCGPYFRFLWILGQARRRGFTGWPDPTVFFSIYFRNLVIEWSAGDFLPQISFFIHWINLLFLTRFSLDSLFSSQKKKNRFSITLSDSLYYIMRKLLCTLKYHKCVISHLTWMVNPTNKFIV